MKRRNSLPGKNVDTKINIGDKFGHLTVLADAQDMPFPNGEYHPNFLCECDCPNHTLIFVMGSRLKNGMINDCGCVRQYANDVIGDTVNENYKLSPTRAADVREDIINKCTNPRAVGYHNFYGANIGVCPQWMDPEYGVMQFYHDMGPSYIMGYEIDRIDQTKDYSPENCHWVAHEDKVKKDKKPDYRMLQCSNGDCYSLKQWQELLGYNSISTIQNRYIKSWPDEYVLCGMPGTRPIMHNAIYFIDENGNPVPDLETENPNRAKWR